ncbi:MAG: dTDP-4-amino-4,6-dideoxygalactose transaminase [Pseudorhodobacter sp.]|nr:dTDP-4-amino-4,6-dideoxygalactose transaminase [Pseudorhodobacter sp.]
MAPAEDRKRAGVVSALTCGKDDRMQDLRASDVNVQARPDRTVATVPFNVAPVVGTEANCIEDALRSGRLSGDGSYGKRCEERLLGSIGGCGALLTSSGTHALEIAALLLRLQPGDEIIMPSFTFVTTANAFVLRGAVPVFVDIRSDTMNIDESLIEAAITPRTRAIVVVHYAGVACEMSRILEIAKCHRLTVIEDAAHAIGASWMEKPLGSIGDIGAFSFHDTKNLTSGGEGGMISLQDPDGLDLAKILREKGTNRSAFREGRVDKYEWIDVGSSYLMNEISAAYLYAQLQWVDDITSERRSICSTYRKAFAELAALNRIELQQEPPEARSPGHLFYLKMRDEADRRSFISFMRDRGVTVVFHYVPLHATPAGRKYGRFVGRDVVTTRDSLRLVRLPVFYKMTAAQQAAVIDAALAYFGENP